MRTWLFLVVCFVCLFSACNTVEYVGIETYNPAEVSFPSTVKKVLIVNNAVPQPDDTGYSYSLYGVKQDTARASADSAAFDACRALGESIVEDSFFEDVLLYHTCTREDNDYLTDKKLTAEAVRTLCEETGTDAVISFDRLLFQMNKDVWAFAEGFAAGTIDLKINGVVRCYLPGRERPLATVYVRDSLNWSETVENLEVLSYFLPLPNEVLRIGWQYIGMKTSPNFVPHWNNETRWLFKSAGARWKEAAAYAASEKWDDAASRWEYIYEYASGWKERAKAASNLALYHEMGTRLETSLDWAEKSHQLFLKHGGEEYNYTKLLQLYVEALNNRILSNQKLNGQFGEKASGNS